MLDLDWTRSRFPALTDGWAFFDNAGGSAPLGTVADAVHDHLRRLGAQVGATHARSLEVAARVQRGREAMAGLFGARPEEIVLGASTTANVRLLARALRPLFGPGDEVVVTDLDHESHIGPWRDLEREGVVVREWNFDRATQALTLEGLERVLTPRTRLVCFTHCANIVGRIHDAKAFVRRIHAAGALACVDAVAYAPHRRVDVAALGADFTLVSLYKLFGPHVGLLHGRHELLVRAASQNHFFKPEDAVPDKLEPGGVNHELVSSLPAILEHLLELEAHHRPALTGDESARLDRAFELIAAHETALIEPLLSFLGARRGVHVLGGADAAAGARVATVAFTVDGVDAASVPPRLDAQRVAVRFGHFYAYRAIEALGLHARNGVVRASLAHYNSPAEVERLIAALDEALPA
jgi:cysteine desulfurase family protein (TIGR01976 family)